MVRSPAEFGLGRSRRQRKNRTSQLKEIKRLEDPGQGMVLDRWAGKLQGTVQGSQQDLKMNFPSGDSSLAIGHFLTLISILRITERFPFPWEKHTDVFKGKEA